MCGACSDGVAVFGVGGQVYDSAPSTGVLYTVSTQFIQDSWWKTYVRCDYG